MGALHRFGSHPNAQTVWNFGIFKFQKCPSNHIPVRDRFHCLSFPLLSVVSAAIKSVWTPSDSQLAAVLSLQSLGLCLFRGRVAFPDFTQGCSSPTSQTGDFHPAEHESSPSLHSYLLLFCLKAFVPDLFCLRLLFSRWPSALVMTSLSFPGFCPVVPLWNRLHSSKSGLPPPCSVFLPHSPCTCLGSVSSSTSMWRQLASFMSISSAGQSRLQVT